MACTPSEGSARPAFRNSACLRRCSVHACQSCVSLAPLLHAAAPTSTPVGPGFSVLGLLCVSVGPVDAGCGLSMPCHALAAAPVKRWLPAPSTLSVCLNERDTRKCMCRAGTVCVWSFVSPAVHAYLLPHLAGCDNPLPRCRRCFVCCCGCCDERHTCSFSSLLRCIGASAPSCLLLVGRDTQLSVLVAPAVGAAAGNPESWAHARTRFTATLLCTDVCGLHNPVTPLWLTGRIREMCRRRRSCHTLNLESKKCRNP